MKYRVQVQMKCLSFPSWEEWSTQVFSSLEECYHYARAVKTQFSHVARWRIIEMVENALSEQDVKLLLEDFLAEEKCDQDD